MKNHGTSLSQLYFALSQTSAEKYLNNQSSDFPLSNSAQSNKELTFSDGGNDPIIETFLWKTNFENDPVEGVSIELTI